MYRVVEMRAQSWNIVNIRDTRYGHTTALVGNIGTGTTMEKSKVRFSCGVDSGGLHSGHTTAVSQEGIFGEPCGGHAIADTRYPSQAIIARLLANKILQVYAMESDNDQPPLPIEEETVRNIMKVIKPLIENNFNKVLDITIEGITEHEELDR